ncbi:hypothetical protein QBC38DRAFT_371848 [Podospora fimiseda]|uniref:BTB domain-containing protein n=1 Tax=Podospora fimiseda TaxID=252190 RepID=A0AAN7BIR6_9PEZI|nr:hypothetical protein QBC38DRAFT_371848 [Podospora fimiseda]
MASPSRTLTATAPIIATGVLGSPGPILTATSALTTAAIIESPGPILTAATAVASTRILLFVLDRDGDLCIRAGKQNPMEFKVDSGALRRASDKFRQKLLGDWLATKPASSDETWLVVLEDAYPYALKVLLQLIHASRLDEIRDDLPIRTIREIVGLVEKWNLHHIVRHRASQWLELAINMAGTTTMVRDLVDINWVALGMGHMALFTQTINRIATMTKCDHNGNLLDSEGLVLQNHYTFPDDDFLGKQNDLNVQ